MKRISSLRARQRLGGLGAGLGLVQRGLEPCHLCGVEFGRVASRVDASARKTPQERRSSRASIAYLTCVIGAAGRAALCVLSQRSRRCFADRPSPRTSTSPPYSPLRLACRPVPAPIISPSSICGDMCARRSWRVPAGASPARVGRSGRSVASVAWSSATAAAKRTQQSGRVCIEPRNCLHRRGRGAMYRRRQHVRHRYARCCRSAGV